MPTDELRSIRIGERTFNYVFRPSKPEDPLLVVLHGHSKTPRPSKLRFEDCNVLCPVDNFGLNRYGSWYLGEGGDFFWIDAMKEIIASVYSGKKVYFIGSSMGGYGAILHGTLNGAIGVYANIPQTKLLGSKYSGQGMERYFSYIFGDKLDLRYNDLRSVVEQGGSTHFDITAIRWDKKGYLQEQVLDFISHLVLNDFSFSFMVVNSEGHGLVQPLNEAAKLLLSNTKDTTTS